MRKEQIHRTTERIFSEGKLFFWIFIYLWVLFGLFAIHKAIVLNDADLIYHQGFAVINALLLAKVMLTAEMLHVADAMKHEPLIYPIILKSAVFSAILICFYWVEEILIGMWHGESFTQSIPALGGGNLKGMLMVGFIMFVLLIPFFRFPGARQGHRGGQIVFPHFSASIRISLRFPIYSSREFRFWGQVGREAHFADPAGPSLPRVGSGFLKIMLSREIALGMGRTLHQLAPPQPTSVGVSSSVTINTIAPTH